MRRDLTNRFRELRARLSSLIETASDVTRCRIRITIDRFRGTL